MKRILCHSPNFVFSVFLNGALLSLFSHFGAKEVPLTIEHHKTKKINRYSRQRRFVYSAKKHYTTAETPLSCYISPSPQYKPDEESVKIKNGINIQHEKLKFVPSLLKEQTR